MQNHGIPEGTIENALSASKEFFSLPLEKKMEVGRQEMRDEVWPTQLSRFSVAGYPEDGQLQQPGSREFYLNIVRVSLPTIEPCQITDVTSPEFRCYELDMSATPGQTGTATVAAGSTIGFKGG